jgi:hypothetical protein
MGVILRGRKMSSDPDLKYNSSGVVGERIEKPYDPHTFGQANTRQAIEPEARNEHYEALDSIGRMERIDDPFTRTVILKKDSEAPELS